MKDVLAKSMRKRDQRATERKGMLMHMPQRVSWVRAHRPDQTTKQNDKNKENESKKKLWTKISRNFLLRGIASIAKHKIEILQ